MNRPFGFALLSAILFGASTPASKFLLSELSPFQLAGLLYFGAAIGIAPAAARGGGIRLPPIADRRNRLRLLGAVVTGGVLGPVLLLFGLRLAPAASVSLWLNFEIAATALLGVLVFRDHLGPRGWGGVALAFVAALILSMPERSSGLLAGGLVALACLCWGVDNHLTSLIDGITPSQSTFWKGLVAGTTNLLLGFLLPHGEFKFVPVIAALFVGVWAYGVSIALYISSAQSLGATRSQVVFSTAPLFGVAFSVLLLRESVGVLHAASAGLFAAGIALLAAERHAHAHEHEAIEHEHGHRHDDGHHTHEHPELARSVWHSHRHVHVRAAHSHPHWPDLHHRHEHRTEP
jgi:drug/metabolite transporter (DMT)-like permease